MAQIISVEPIQSPIKRLWKFFQSFESFTKLTILTSLLIIISTPFIVKNRQIFNPKAEEQATCPSLPEEKIGEKPDKDRAQLVTGLLDGKTRELSQTILKHKNVSGSEKNQLTGQLLKLAKERKSFLIEAMRKNPDAALSSILSDEERATLTTINQDCVETVATLEGTLEVLHADFFEEGVSDTSYILFTSDGKQIQLHPAGRTLCST